MLQATRRLEFRTREQIVYEHLRRAIAQGQWGPDDPIVGSRVSTELGVSRITVANALKRLAGEGFVRLTPHKEAFVARVSAADVEEIYHMRAALEAEIVGFAAQRVTPADLRHLRELNRRLGEIQATGDIARMRTADHALHAAIRAAAGMPRLARMLGNLVDQCEYYRARLLDRLTIAVPTPTRHEALLAALESGDVEQARELAREHVLHGMRWILTALEHDDQ